MLFSFLSSFAYTPCVLCTACTISSQINKYDPDQPDGRLMTIRPTEYRPYIVSRYSVHSSDGQLRLAISI